MVRALALLALALGLAACGGDDEPAEPTQPAQTAPATTEATPTETEAAKTPAGTTPPGAELKLGETAKVTLTPLDAGFDSKVRYRVDATVESIEKGSIGDFKSVNLEPEQKKSTPYYVKVRVVNAGRALPAKEDVDVRFDGIDDRGQEQPSVIFIGDFPKCDAPAPPNRFAKGQTLESCLVYLVPGGAAIEEVRWSGSSEYLSDPVSWK